MPAAIRSQKLTRWTVESQNDFTNKQKQSLKTKGIKI